MSPDRAVFADTFYWIALLNPRDSSYQLAHSLDDALQAMIIITTEEVLSEVLAYFSAWGRKWRSEAVFSVRDILSDPAVRVMPQSHESFLAGLDLYEARLDKGYSLTDCISMNTMKAESIIDILTNDRHFAQEGFRILFGP